MTGPTSSPSPLPDQGVFDLPHGKLATLVTYLALEPVVKHRPDASSHNLVFERVIGKDHARYLGLFRQIGSPWLWFSRLMLAEHALVAALDHPDNLAFIVRNGQEDIGLCEVDCRKAGEAELLYLGLIPQASGKGFGRIMINHAIDCVIDRQIDRMIVHTCHLDDPRAPGFYRSCGFEPYQLALEIMDDPRSIGLYPMEAAPQIPFLGERKV